ncbi:TonB-dependent receptor [Tannerella sp. oral taxon 808]|nr:TonB-dependent receptor [Tannerella sp. oral taxon 808]
MKRQRRYTRCSLLATALSLCLAFASAQRIKISGNVRDADGNPVELVLVQVKQTMNGAMTDEKGFYSLTVSPADSVVLVFSCLGYHKAERIIPRPAGDMRVNVQLTSAALELGEVSVTATRRQTTTMESLDANRIKILPDPSGGSIESLVVTYAGVSSNNELSSQYSVRGGSYDENMVYVNGMEVFRPLLIRSGQQEGLSFINPNLTEQVQFSAGGFEARYGDKMSSVLDITYKRPRGWEGAATLGMLASSHPTLSTANAYVGSAGKRFTQVTGIRYRMSSSLLSDADARAEYEPRFVDLQTFMTYRPAPKWEVNFLGNIASNHYTYRPIELQTRFGTTEEARVFHVYFDGRERDRFDTYYGALTLKHTPSDKSEVGLQAFAFRSNEEESYDIEGAYRLDKAGEDKEAEASSLSLASYYEHARNRLQATVAHVGVYGLSGLSSFHTLKWGAGLQSERFVDRISEWESRDSSGYSLPQTGREVNVIANLFSNNSLSSMRASGYAQDVIKFRTPQGLFTVIAGLRASYWSYNRELLISPRASVGFIPTANQDITLRLATGLYSQSPFYKELRVEQQDAGGNTVVRLNSDLKAQRSIHFILGGDYSFKVGGRNFKLSSEVYYKNLSRINPYTVDNVKIRYYGENCARGYIVGWDTKLFGEFVPGADSWISLSLMQARQTIDRTGQPTVEAPLPNSPAYNLSLYFQDYFPGYRRAMVNLRGVLTGGLPVTVPRQGYTGNTFRTPAYRRVDIGFTYQLVGGESRVMDSGLLRHFKNLWIGVDVFNLLDIYNTGSYYWITDVYNHRYAVPNYLTGRQLNLRLSADF